MRKIKNNRQFWETAELNNDTFIQYYNRITELAVSMFDWQNLPDTIDPRYLELALFSDGMAVFFYDDDIGFLCLRSMIGGNLNVYGIPEQRTAYATNGYNRSLDSSNSVLIFNNYLHTNSLLDVQLFARKLANIDRTIDVNITSQKTPVLIQCDETQRLTMKNLYQKYDGNEPYIFGDKSLNANNLKVLKTDSPFVADKLYTLKSTIWNEMLTYLGISNVNIVKKERMLTDEVLRNQGGTIANRYSRLNARQEAVDKINKMFGLNIQVNYRDDLPETQLENSDESELSPNE